MGRLFENCSQTEANIPKEHATSAVYESAYEQLRREGTSVGRSTTEGVATEFPATVTLGNPFKEDESQKTGENQLAGSKDDTVAPASGWLEMENIFASNAKENLNSALASALDGLFGYQNHELGGFLDNILGSVNDGWLSPPWGRPEKSFEERKQAAIAELDGHSEGGMISDSDRSSIRNIEHSIINGDLQTLTNELKDIVDNQPDRLPAFVSEVNKHLGESHAQVRLGLGDAGRVGVFDDQYPDSALVIDSVNGTMSVNPWEGRNGDLVVSSTPWGGANTKATITPGAFAQEMSAHATNAIAHNGSGPQLPSAPPERHSGLAYHFDDNPLGNDELNAKTQRDFADKFDRASYEAKIMREKGWDYFNEHRAEIDGAWANHYGITKIHEAAQDRMDSATSDLLSDVDRERLQSIHKAILSDDVTALRNEVMPFSGDSGKMQALAQELTKNFQFAGDGWSPGVYYDQDGMTIGSVNISPDGQIRERVTRSEPVPGSFDKKTIAYEPVSTEYANFELHRISQLVVDHARTEIFGYDYPFRERIVPVNEANPHPRNPVPTNRGTIASTAGTIRGGVPISAPVPVTDSPGFDSARTSQH